MPRMILYNNTGQGAGSGPAYYIGRAKPPFTIRFSGGWTVATFAIETAPGTSDMAQSALTYSTDMGEMGIAAAGSQETNNLTGITNSTITVAITHPVDWIRATTTGTMTGSALVTLIMNQ